MKIEEFQGEYRWLSNFWPTEILVRGERYPSVEFAFVACKTEDPAERARVLKCRSAGNAKRLGRTLTLRAGWDSRPGQEPLKVEVIRGLLRCKFRAGSELALKLMATGEAELIEGNSWGDTWWGVCRGKGQNMLGQLLMQRREELKVLTLEAN
jgi:ribA/ribD-fused uncharacterized protein